MREFQPESLIEQLFKRIRKEFKLGMREYLIAIDAVRSDDLGVTDWESLKEVLLVVWCHSRAEQRQFTDLWEMATAEQKEFPRKSNALPDVPERTEITPAQEVQPLPRQEPIAVEQPSPEPEHNLSPLPIQSPLLPAEVDSSIELESYWPVSRRSMQYIWRYLRRPLADGPRTVLDLQSTVEQVARQGFFLEPVYQRQEVNHAHLVLLVDQGGSMIPFHRFTRDLVETAMDERSLSHIGVYYFYNVPASHVYEDQRLSVPVSLDTVLAQCDLETSVLIVSDAGAARGHRQIGRFKETTTFLVQLRQRTNLIGWLNPMPTERWESTTAEMISFVVPMEQMDDDGFSNIIDVIRGQTLFALHSGEPDL